MRTESKCESRTVAVRGDLSTEGCTGTLQEGQVWPRWNQELAFQTCSLLRYLLDIRVDVSGGWTDTQAESPEKRVMWEIPVFPWDLKTRDWRVWPQANNKIAGTAL